MSDDEKGRAALVAFLEGLPRRPPTEKESVFWADFKRREARGEIQFRTREEWAAFRDGAATAFGLLGMAEMIRTTYGHLLSCWMHSPPYDGGPCMRCGFDNGWRRTGVADKEQGR